MSEAAMDIHEELAALEGTLADAPPEADANPPTDYAAELDRLNAEFNAEHPEESPADPQEPDGDPLDPYTLSIRMADLEGRNRQLEVESLIAARERDIGMSMKTVKDTFDLAIADTPLRKLLVGMVAENPDYERAWQARAEDPRTWGNALKKMGAELAKDFQRREWTPTSDIEAMEASVRGQASGNEPRRQIDATGVINMTNAEYAAWERDALAPDSRR